MADTESERPRRSRQSRMILAAKIVLPVVILAGALAVTVGASRRTAERVPVQEKVWPVSAVRVAFGEEQPELRLFGKVVAGREVVLRPLVAGRVVEVGANVVEGGLARQGELLIAIDPFDYEAKVAENEARIAEIRAKIEEYKIDVIAEKELIERDRELVALRERETKRRKRLRAKGSGSQKALDDSRMALNEQRQRLIGRRQSVNRFAARIDQQRAVEKRLEVALARASRDLERTRLTAPFDAYLVETDIAVGKMVGTGDRVARLIDARWLEVRFHMSDDQFARVIGADDLRGRAATAIWRTATREFRFKVTVDRISSEIDAASGGVDLFARIHDTGLDTILRPGAFVEIRVPGRVYRNVARLPEGALHGGDTVYVMVDGRLEPKKVQFVARAGNDVLVRGAIHADEMVVTTSFSEIGPGVRVEAR